MRKLSISIVEVKVDSKAFNSGDNLAARTSRDQWPSYAILEYGLRALIAAHCIGRFVILLSDQLSGLSTRSVDIVA